jgi:biopolymer transport protein ExbD
MAFGGFSGDIGTRPMAEINMIPLIDVMLVLLIIFIVTAPLLTHAIKVDLPDATTQVTEEKPETITLSIDALGNVYWNNTQIAHEELYPRLLEAAGQDPQPELHLRAEYTTQYQKVAEVMAAAQNARISRIGFITEPLRGAR